MTTNTPIERLRATVGSKLMLEWPTRIRPDGLPFFNREHMGSISSATKRELDRITPTTTNTMDTGRQT